MNTRTQSHGELAQRPIVVWQFTDGKSGHMNQTRGLVRALAERLPLEVHAIAVRKWPWLTGLWAGRWAEHRALPNPDLLLGTGHRTHPLLLAARFWRGGRAVVLMRPTIPLSWFNLCIIPDHDLPVRGSGWLEVRGVLNTIKYRIGHEAARGLILIGGPCRHAHWSNEAITQQVLEVVSGQPAVHWTLTTSRRTPTDFLQRLTAKQPANLELVPASKTDADWVARQLAEAAQVWVTPDSVSMVYEALTSGAAVGLLDLELVAGSKLTGGLRRLIEKGWVTPFSRHSAERSLPAPTQRLDEAGRCADWIVQHWFSARQK